MSSRENVWNESVLWVELIDFCTNIAEKHSEVHLQPTVKSPYNLAGMQCMHLPYRHTYIYICKDRTDRISMPR